MQKQETERLALHNNQSVTNMSAKDSQSQNDNFSISEFNAKYAGVAGSKLVNLINAREFG